MNSQLQLFQPDGRRFRTIQDRFAEFHRLNPWVYQQLVELARNLARKGRRRIGLKMLFEVLRWKYYQETTDPNSNWKLNNVFTSRYARLIEANEPDLEGVFELRKLIAK